MKKKESLIKNNKGQGVMEYMIITSLVGILCLSAMKDFGETVQSKVKQVRKKISKQIKI